MKHSDKVHHIVYSLALTVVGAFLFGPVIGAIFALAIGAGKELVWDGHFGRGHADLWDMVANVVGVTIAMIVISGM